MNIIVWTRRGGSRQINLAAPLSLSAFVAGGLLFVGLNFALAFAVVESFIVESPGAQAQRWRAELESEQARLAEVRQSSREKLEALNAQLGRIRAEVTRLNALGERLTRMAGLEEGEFNFGVVPAQGGPEEPIDRTAPEVQSGLGVEEGVEDLGNQVSDRSRQFQILERLLMNRNVQERVRPEGRPIGGGWVSSSYGSRTDPITGRRAWHGGIDFAGREGSDVRSVAAGVVTWSGPRYGYGRLVEVNHGNGYVTRYAHNKETLVEVGDMVRKGQRVALLGQSGRATGPHVHFEVHYNGRSVNPAEFIRAGN